MRGSHSDISILGWYHRRKCKNLQSSTTQELGNCKKTASVITRAISRLLHRNRVVDEAVSCVDEVPFWVKPRQCVDDAPQLIPIDAPQLIPINAPNKTTWHQCEWRWRLMCQLTYIVALGYMDDKILKVIKSQWSLSTRQNAHVKVTSFDNRIIFLSFFFHMNSHWRGHKCLLLLYQIKKCNLPKVFLFFLPHTALSQK